jgi:four helix bundle protein
MKNDNVVKHKSFAFAIRIVKLCKYLSAEKKEYDLSRQLIRSGTAIGALVREAEHGQSKADFIHKIAIALKEANETEYWLDLLFHTQIISEEEYKSIQPDISELNKLLISISKSAKK